jgi:CSLREA domain-containing protein
MKLGLILLFILCVLPNYPLNGAVFTVNTTLDTVDVSPGDGEAADNDGLCSLRAAIMEANTLEGPDTIILPPGFYEITIPNDKANDIETGDLDIRSDLTIEGESVDTVFIDANRRDRVFHILGDCTVTLKNLVIQNGKSQSYLQDDDGNPIPGEPGGGICCQQSTVNIYYCTITENVTGNGQKGVYRGCSSSGSGGGIYMREGTLTVENSVIQKNSTGIGGCEHFARSGDGGGIANFKGELILKDSEINNNQIGEGGEGRGAGVYNLGVATVSNCVFAGNSGIGHIEGGGFYNYGTAIIERCTFKENIGDQGGGFYNLQHRAEISSSLFYRNEARFGAGISCDHSSLVLTNCTVSENWSCCHAYGAGLESRTSSIKIINCTICNNFIHYAGKGGGIADNLDWAQSSNIQIQNSIIANNSLGASEETVDIMGTVHSLGHNLIGNTNGCTITGDTTGSFLNVNPQLGVLQDNGGPTLTHAPLPYSITIDRGSVSNSPATDQRGVPRPKDGNLDGSAIPDIGAVEVSHPAVTFTSPAKGSTVSGMSLIEASTNCVNTAFYCDETLLKEVSSSPRSCVWDTTVFSNGWHTIKAVGYDIPDLCVEAKIPIKIDNIIVDLKALRRTEKGWLIRKQFADIQCSLSNIHSKKIQAVILECRQDDGPFNIIHEVNGDRISGEGFTYQYLFLDPQSTYSFKATVFAPAAEVIGRSKEVAIQ